MARNSLSPAFVKITYGSTTHTHHMKFPTLFDGTVTPGIIPNLKQYDGTPVALGTYVVTIVTLMRAFFAADISFTLAEAWSQPTPEDDPIYIASYSITGGTGTGGGSTVLASQKVMTWRTNIGGLYKTYFMDTNTAPNLTYLPPYAGLSAELLYQNHVMGSGSCVYGLDGGKIIAPLKTKTKTNDALRRRYGL